ncbi:MAG: hypothetical protein M1826_005874 [Phylliscum demangeonii]|nr:MAG: hypothetical protein M1826_005874 [Phylliscum demangeonii]
MPFKQNFFKSSNKSQASLGPPDPSKATAVVESPLPSPVISISQPLSAASSLSPDEPFGPGPPRAGHLAFAPLDRPTIHVVGIEQAAGDDPPPFREQQQQQQQHDLEPIQTNRYSVTDSHPPSHSRPPAPQESKRSKRSFFGLGHHHSASKDHQPRHAAADLAPVQPDPLSGAQGNTAGLGRRVSLRRKDGPTGGYRQSYSPTEAQSPPPPPPLPNPWSTGPTSIPRLAASKEDEGEDGEGGEHRHQNREGGQAPYILRSHDGGAPIAYGNPSVSASASASTSLARQGSVRSDYARPYPLHRVKSENAPLSPHLHLHPHPHPDDTLDPPTRKSSILQQPLPYQPSPVPGAYQTYQPSAAGSSAPSPFLDQLRAGAQQPATGVPPEDNVVLGNVTPEYSTLPSPQPHFQAYHLSSQILHPLHPQDPRRTLPSQAPDETLAMSTPAQSGPGHRLPEDQAAAGQGPVAREGSSVSQGYGPPGTRQSQQFRGAPLTLPPQPQQHQGHQFASDHARSGSPKNRPSNETGELDLHGKYNRVKRLYHERGAQIEQLQNTLAHQRLSQSRTSLDDNEYATRFNRLDGAINNLAFNIRKDWRTVPAWLQPVINDDARTKGTKEMTIVGRAFITRWLLDELLDRHFHPSIDVELSMQLKNMEKNLRRLAVPPQSVEEEEALVAKISAWRLTTFDSLQDVFPRPRAAENRARLIDMMTKNLIDALHDQLNDPPPAGVDGSVTMIVELAVGLASHLLVESRDVFVYYPMPGTIVSSDKVSLETGMPPLLKPTGVGHDHTGEVTMDKGSLPPAMAEVKELNALADQTRADSDATSLKEQQAAGRKKSMLGSFMSKKSAPSSSSTTTDVAGQTPTPASASQSSLLQQQQQQQQQQQASTQLPAPPTATASTSSTGNDGGGGMHRVRVAAFMTVEVRGRSILVKAPIWTF